jgi:hypothetical protein
MRSCPGSRYICQPTLGCGVFPYPFGRTVRCASSDICSSIALTVIAVLQRLDMFSRGADKSLALPWKKTICSEQYLQQYTKTYGVQKQDNIPVVCKQTTRIYSGQYIPVVVSKQQEYIKVNIFLLFVSKTTRIFSGYFTQKHAYIAVVCTQTTGINPCCLYAKNINIFLLFVRKQQEYITVVFTQKEEYILVIFTQSTGTCPCCLYADNINIFLLFLSRNRDILLLFAYRKMNIFLLFLRRNRNIFLLFVCRNRNTFLVFVCKQQEYITAVFTLEKEYILVIFMQEQEYMPVDFTQKQEYILVICVQEQEYNPVF